MSLNIITWQCPNTTFSRRFSACDSSNWKAVKYSFSLMCGTCVCCYSDHFLSHLLVWLLWLFTCTYREMRFREEVEKFRQERPKIQQQFSDLKRQLTEVSADQWDNLPEVGGSVRQKRQRSTRPERYTPLPDSIIERNANMSSVHNSLDARQQVRAACFDLQRSFSGEKCCIHARHPLYHKAPWLAVCYDPV